MPKTRWRWCPSHSLPLAVSPDGSILATPSSAIALKLYSSSGMQLTGPITNQQVLYNSLIFSSDGSKLTCANGKFGSIFIWDIHKVLKHASISGAVPRTSETKVHRGLTDGDSDSKHWFNDTSEIDNSGWLRGPNDELLLWIPPHHRKKLLRPSNIVRHVPDETKLDFSQFVAGEHWAECYTPKQGPKSNSNRYFPFNSQA
jgi:WD40 repeat protein